MAAMMRRKKILFERIGGKDAVNVAVDIFYEKVLTDPQLKSFMTGWIWRGRKKSRKRF